MIRSVFSLLEGKDIIEPQLLDEVAKALKVPVEAINNFDEQAAINYFNTFQEGSINHGHFSPTFDNCTYNPIDKVVEFCERMIKDRDAMIEELKKLMSK